MAKIHRIPRTELQASNLLRLALSVLVALFATAHLHAGEPPEDRPENTGESLDGSWLFDWVTSGRMTGATSWKQIRVSRDGGRIHLRRLSFEGLGKISETSLSFDVLDEWQGEGPNGILLLHEKKAKAGAPDPSEATPGDRYAVWAYEPKPDWPNGMTFVTSPSLLDELATPDEEHARQVFEKNKLALTESKPLPLHRSHEAASIPFRSKSSLLESAKLPPLPIEDPAALATLSWCRTNPFAVMLEKPNDDEVEGGAVGMVGMLFELMGSRDHGSFVENGFSPLSGRVANLYWDGGNFADPILLQQKFETDLETWLHGSPAKKKPWAAKGPELEQFRKKVTTAFKKGDPDLIMALFNWRGVDQFSKDSEFASWRELFHDFEYETESVHLVRPDEVFRRVTKLEMDGWSSGGIKYHPNVKVFGAVSINLALAHIQIPFGTTAEGKWALAGIVCDRKEAPGAEDRALPARPDSLEALYLQLMTALESGDVETIMKLYDWKAYTPFQKDRERFAWTEYAAVLKARRGAAEKVALSYIAFQKHAGQSEEMIREQIQGELEVDSEEGKPLPGSLENLVLTWVIQDWDDLYPGYENPETVDGSNFGFEVDGRKYHGLPGELLLFSWRPSSNQRGELVHQFGAGKAQDGGYVLCPIVLPKRIREDFNRL